MISYSYEAKSKEEAIELALKELKVLESDLIIQVISEKGGLFKKTIIKVYNINDIINILKETLVAITKEMGININLEVRRRNNSIAFKMFSDNNSILIGKNGKTISAFQTIIKQILANENISEIHVTIDVENYKEKKAKNIEYLAKKVAREVARTKLEVKMDSMNSYERRLVHSTLSNHKYIYTISEGEEPNRYVVIKPKEEN